VADALINLIDNAIKYSDRKKQIDVLTGSGAGTVYVLVKDYGVGIEEKDQKLVFDKFYRVTHGDLAYKAKGSGIGLSIVKHIMDAHGGRVTLKSTPGKGSSFTLHFPGVSA
jgi:two-component system, OmpR family, phosphate regulon sensor histidine kinase PhoR